MKLQSKNKVDTAFSLASMTDVIFLLLIFFMLTSSFVTPSGLPVSLPSSKATTIEMQKVSVTITKDLQYYINEKPVPRAAIQNELKNALNQNNTQQGVVILHVDKAVAVEYFVEVAGIANSLKAKVSIATIPQ